MTRVLLALALAAPLSAQNGGVQLEIALSPPASAGAAGSPAPDVRVEAPSIAATRLLADAHMRELLRNGFPARLHFRLELWKKSRWFDDLVGSTDWDVLVSYDPASQVYRARRKHGNQTEDFGRFATLTSVETEIDRPYRVDVRAPESGRYYYALALDIFTLDSNDLDELQRWLRGEAQPAVRGQGNPFTALRRGVGVVLSRWLGGDRRHYEQQSSVFGVP